jgi:hypothetical protein
MVARTCCDSVLLQRLELEGGVEELTDPQIRGAEDVGVGSDYIATEGMFELAVDTVIPEAAPVVSGPHLAVSGPI